MNELLELLEPLAAGPFAAEPQSQPWPAVPQLPRLPSHLTRRADGEVIVTGTRVRAVDVFAAVASGVQLDDLAEAFPQVRPDRLAGVVAFRAAHLEAVDAYTRWRSERTGPTGASRPKGQTRPSTASEPHGASDQGMGALASAGVSNGMTGPPAESVAPAELPATAALAAHTPPAAPTAPAAPAPAPAGLRAPAEPVEPRHPDPAE